MVYNYLKGSGMGAAGQLFAIHIYWSKAKDDVPYPEQEKILEKKKNLSTVKKVKYVL